jgi:hypothetical protein
MIISKQLLKGGSVNVCVKNGQIEFDVKKGKKGAIIEASQVEMPDLVR